MFSNGGKMKIIKFITLAIIAFYTGSALAQNVTPQISDEQAHEIVLNGTPDDVKKLILNGYDVNTVYHCNTLLITAIKSAARGAYAHTASFYALEKIKALIEAGADVNAYSCPENSMRPLAWAITLPEQMEESGDYILKNIEDKIKTENEYCDFPGILSKPCRDISKQEKKQIEISIKNDFKTAIKLSKKNFINIVEILINNGADVNGRDAQNQSVLHHAVINPQYASTDFIKYLVDKGANINAQDVYGHTPLFIASGLKNENAVNALIKLGADSNIQANDGSTYRDVGGQIKRVFYQ